MTYISESIQRENYNSSLSNIYLSGDNIDQDCLSVFKIQDDSENQEIFYEDYSEYFQNEDFSALSDAYENLSVEDKNKVLELLNDSVVFEDGNYYLRTSYGSIIVSETQIENSFPSDKTFSNCEKNVAAFFSGMNDIIEQAVSTKTSSSLINKIANEGISSINSDNLVQLLFLVTTGNKLSDIEDKYILSESYQFDINKKIDETSQGSLDDCWLIATLTSLSFSKNGEKLLNNAVKIDQNGDFSINFKGVDTSVKVTKEEMFDEKNNGKYAKGDDDVILFEIAYRKIMNKIRSGQTEAPDFIKQAAIEGETSISGGIMKDAVYLLTGDISKHQYNCEHLAYKDDFLSSILRKIPGLTYLFKSNMDYVYDLLEKNPENYCATISFWNGDDDLVPSSPIVAKDINGENVVLTNSSHSWSIKEVQGNNVVLVNPWDTSVEVTFEKDEISKYVSGIAYYELN